MELGDYDNYDDSDSRPCLMSENLSLKTKTKLQFAMNECFFLILCFVKSGKANKMQISPWRNYFHDLSTKLPLASLIKSL